MIYNDNLFIKLPKKMKQEIQEKAEKNSKTISDYVRGLIVEDLKENN